MLINQTLTFLHTKLFASVCAKLLNWFANTRKCVAFCDANHLDFHHWSEASQFSGFDQASCRVDKFFYDRLANMPEYAKLWAIVKIILLLSHGQTTVERGFSVNKEVESYNLQADTFTARRTRKPSYRWQTRATRKAANNCSNSMCLQRCRWQYWPIFTRLAVVASEICEIPRNSLKIQTYGFHGHPRSSILVSIESPCTTSY